MHDFASLGDDMKMLLALSKTSGDSGDTGDKSENGIKNNDLAVTSRRNMVSPLDKRVVTGSKTSGDAYFVEKQSVSEGVTTVTSVTSHFEEGVAAFSDAVRRLRAMQQLDSFWGDRWSRLIDDAAAFVAAWGDQAKHLGWTELHLFGVHPKVPAARFDVMGLIPLLDGGRVIALTDATATIRKPSGSIQRHTKRAPGCAVRIWELQNAAGD